MIKLLTGLQKPNQLLIVFERLFRKKRPFFVLIQVV